MGSRVFAILSLLFFTLSSLGAALPANSLHEAEDASETMRSWWSLHPTPTPCDLSTLTSGGTLTLISVSEAAIFGTFQTRTFMLSPLPTLPLSTFSERSPIWSSGSPYTLTTLLAGSGFNPFSSATTTSTSSTEMPTIASTATPSVAVVTSIYLTSSTSTVVVFPSMTITPSKTINSSKTANPSDTTAGAVAYATSTSKAVAPTLMAGVGSLLGVALAAVALL